MNPTTASIRPWTRAGAVWAMDYTETPAPIDGRFPWTYLDVPISDVLDDIGMSLDEFQAVCDRFTNKKIFQVDRHGNLVRDASGSLVKINDDNPD